MRLSLGRDVNASQHAQQAFIVRFHKAEVAVLVPRPEIDNRSRIFVLHMSSNRFQKLLVVLGNRLSTDWAIGDKAHRLLATFADVPATANTKDRS